MEIKQSSKSLTLREKTGLKLVLYFYLLQFCGFGLSLFDRFDRFTDYADTFTTGMFFAAMWLMANKKIEHWILWIIANSISIPLYLVKGLGFTAIQYFLFLILAYQGWLAWKKKCRITQ